MDPALLTGLAVAALAAVGLNVGYVLQSAALQTVPAVSASRPLASVGALVRSPGWRAGALLSYGGLGLNVVALALAPLPLVQSVLAGGLVLVAVAARRARGTPTTRTERAAIDAVERWEFKPATRNGEPVDSTVTNRINFKL